MRAVALAALLLSTPLAAQTWIADNGDGTFTNPLFYEDFPDPDIIRVGDDYYMTGTTQHVMPGLPILHSRDLVNWTFLAYAFDTLDLGPDMRLEGGRDMYGQGIWAPSLRYRDGTFYIFSNVNGHATQVFRATNPRGPWRRTPMKRSLHDIGVLFDDDGKAYAVWGYREVRMAELNAALDDIVPGTERVIIPPEAGMGEGAHVYKINGIYYITSAWFVGRMRMPAARATSPYGPYEVNPAISLDEGFGLYQGERLKGDRGPPFVVLPPNRSRGRTVMHQGGIVDTPGGQWWGFSMTDFNSLGRLTALSPVTWQDGWPYFGLPGNLGRTPRTWVKPALPSGIPRATFRRSDGFSSVALSPIWQWNHVPDAGRWSLTARRGFLRLSTAPAHDLFGARNTLTQRAVGPRSRVTVALDGSGLRDGDVTGLALLGLPYAQLGIVRTSAGRRLSWFDQRSGATADAALNSRRVWLRADCDFLKETAQFSYSLDGRRFIAIGTPSAMIFQTRTFQGIRYALYAYNTLEKAGGHADFDDVTVGEPFSRGLSVAIPVGRRVILTSIAAGTALSVRDTAVVGTAPATAAAFTIVGKPLGRVALASGAGHVSITATGDAWLKPGAAGTAETFQWMESIYGEPMLMSLATNRFLTIAPATGIVSATSPGANPDGTDHARWRWQPT